MYFTKKNAMAGRLEVYFGAIAFAPLVLIKEVASIILISFYIQTYKKYAIGTKVPFFNLAEAVMK